MATDHPPLKRSLFGYRKRTVHELLSDRETMAREAEERSRALEQELARVRDQVERELAPPPDAPGGQVATPPAQVSVDLPTEALDLIRTAGESVERIADIAAESGRRQSQEADRLRDDLRNEVGRLTAWQGAVQSAVRSLRASIDEAQARIDAVPGRIRDALTPLDEAVRSLDSSLDALSGAGEPLPPEPSPDRATEDSSGAGSPVDSRDQAAAQPGDEADAAAEAEEGAGAEAEGGAPRSPERLGDAWSARAAWL